MLAGLADQAAVAIANVHLIGELERVARGDARRADAERTLREIAARVSSILDPADGPRPHRRRGGAAARTRTARASTCGTTSPGALRWAYSAGDAMREVPEWGRTGGLKPRQAVAGLAFQTSGRS